MQIEQATFWHDNNERLIKLVDYLHEDLQRYKLSENAKPGYINKQERIINTIEEFANSARQIINFRQLVIYYTSEDLKDERHLLYQNQQRSDRALMEENHRLKEEVAGLRNLLNIHNKFEYAK